MDLILGDRVFWLGDPLLGIVVAIEDNTTVLIKDIFEQSLQFGIKVVAFSSLSAI
jgi:hypothetical protein